MAEVIEIMAERVGFEDQAVLKTKQVVLESIDTIPNFRTV